MNTLPLSDGSGKFRKLEYTEPHFDRSDVFQAKLGMIAKIRSIVLVAGFLAWLAAICVPETVAQAAEKKCKIFEILELPITMNSLRPTVTAQINGRDAKFLLDSGAFYSLISSATAAIYGLKLRPNHLGYKISGVGGVQNVSLATVDEFSIAGAKIKKLEFLVGGSDDTSYAGMLGQNLLQKFDVEYDLANGAIRLFQTEDCQKALLAYWLTPDQGYSSMPIESIDAANAHTVGLAYVNGQKIRVAFDSGAFTSVLSTKAAARAGVTPNTPGVVEAGYSRGIGKGMVKSYLAPFASFKIGDDEEIRNTKLRIADLDLGFADMLLGADFFVSHRIFVANREQKLYLTYNGGPVFNLSRGAAQTAATGAADQTDAPPDRPAATGDATVPSQDAAAIARRGTALAARREYVPALAALSQAIELSPQEPEYYFERAQAYRGNGQRDLALADLDHLIEINPDYLAAFVPRAELHLAKGDLPAALADLEAADRLAPKPSDLRYTLAEVYFRMHRLPEVIAQLTLWIQYHGDDSRWVGALRERCLSRVLLDQDLPDALSDCNTVLRRGDKKDANYSQVLVDRGLLRLRQGSYDKAISDFDDALKMSPKNARALYARGLAKARKNQVADSQADLAAATAIEPKVAENFEPFGLYL